MSTTNEIKNLVLFTLGYPKDVDFTDTDDPDVKSINKIYDICKSHALSSHFWNFATTVVELSGKTTETDKPYTYSYDLPDDIIIAHTGFTDKNRYSRISDYEIKGDKFYTNNTTVFLEYVYDVADADLPDYFLNWFKYYVANHAVQPLTGDTELQKINTQLEMEYYKSAKNIDAMQVRTKQIPSSPFQSVRGFF